MTDCNIAMEFPQHHDERAAFAWPEPLMIEVLREAYARDHGASDATEAARIHVRFIEKLMRADTKRAAVLRLELIALCAARSIAVAEIEAADALAFVELNKIVEHRFRNSPRIRLEMMRQLVDAVRRLPERAPLAKPRAGRSWAALKARIAAPSLRAPSPVALVG